MGVDADVDLVGPLRHVDDFRARLPVERAREHAAVRAEASAVGRRVRGLHARPQVAATVDTAALKQRAHSHALTGRRARGRPASRAVAARILHAGREPHALLAAVASRSRRGPPRSARAPCPPGTTPRGSFPLPTGSIRTSSTQAVPLRCRPRLTGGSRRAAGCRSRSCRAPTGASARGRSSPS